MSLIYLWQSGLVDVDHPQAQADERVLGSPVS